MIGFFKPASRRPVLPRHVRFLLSLLMGLALGGALSYLAMHYRVGFGRITLPPWHSTLHAGSVLADPYSKAGFIWHLDAPIGEGVSFTAHTDANGQALSGACQYQIIGSSLRAPWWTLTLYDLEGHLLSTPANRSSLTSQEILWAKDGSFHIQLAPQPQTGNWLPTQKNRPFQLILRLYETDQAQHLPAFQNLPIFKPHTLPRLEIRGCS